MARHGEAASLFGQLTSAYVGQSSHNFQTHPSLARRFGLDSSLNFSKERAPTSLQFAHDGEHLACGQLNGNLSLYSLSDHRAISSYQVHDGLVSSVAFAPYSLDRILSASHDTTVATTDPTLGIRLGPPLKCHHGRARCAVWVDSNVYLTSGDDATVRLIDPREPHTCSEYEPCSTAIVCLQSTKTTTVELPGYGPITASSKTMVELSALACDPRDSNYFVTGGRDPIVRLYDLRKVASEMFDPCVRRFCPKPLMSKSKERAFNVSSLSYSWDAKYVLASYAGAGIYKIDVSAESAPSVPADTAPRRKRSEKKARGRSRSSSVQGSATGASWSDEDSDLDDSPSKKPKTSDIEEDEKPANESFGDGLPSLFANAPTSSVFMRMHPLSGGIFSMLPGLLGGHANNNANAPITAPSPQPSPPPPQPTAQPQATPLFGLPLFPPGFWQGGDGTEDSATQTPDDAPPRELIDLTNQLFSDISRLIPLFNADMEGPSRPESPAPASPSTSGTPSPGTRSSTTVLSGRNSNRKKLPVLETEFVSVYEGHLNQITLTKAATFLGPLSNFVVSGSDEGRLFVWDTDTSELLCAVNNCDASFVHRVAAHPTRALIAAIGSEPHLRFFLPIEPTNPTPSTLKKIVEENLETLKHSIPVQQLVVNIVRFNASNNTSNPGTEAPPPPPPEPTPFSPLPPNGGNHRNRRRGGGGGSGGGGIRSFCPIQ